MRFQTGIDVFDTNTGGIYPGVILLVEESGAGGKEFALTSLMNLARREDRRLYYASMTADDEEIIREFRLTFPSASDDWISKIEVKSFSKEYFSKTILPISWITEERPSLSSLKTDSLIEKLIDFFEYIHEESVVVLDSLTALIRKTEVLGGDEIEWKDLIDMLIGVRKIIIRKNLLNYVLLTKGVAGKAREEEIFSNVDGIVVFEWIEEKETLKRTMYIKKLTGTLAILEKQRFSKFDVSLDPSVGFVISKLHRII
jgi:KaiC/GvpD/RAD55 family RecA-like ATPase